MKTKEVRGLQSIAKAEWQEWLAMARIQDRHTWPSIRRSFGHFQGGFFQGGFFQGGYLFELV